MEFCVVGGNEKNRSVRAVADHGYCGALLKRLARDDRLMPMELGDQNI